MLVMEEEVVDLEKTQNFFGMVELLKNHYGDGSIYIPDVESVALLKWAMSQGYVNEEGYLTRAGRTLVTQYR